MKNMPRITALFLILAMAVLLLPMAAPAKAMGDLIEEEVSEGADVLRQGVYYYELAEMSGDYGEGLSPREGALLVDALMADMGLYVENGGIPAEQCVYISLDELAFLDSCMMRECYIYSVGIGTPEGGLMGDGYEVVYRVSVDYGGDKTAAIYDDFSDATEENTLMLVANFSNGVADGEIRIAEVALPSQNEMPASDALMAFYLAGELSDWTGLDFALNDVWFDEDSVTVDWSKESTLLAGLGDKEQKEEFFFFDAVSLNWFMMDSLADTLRQNFDVTAVYYASEGQPIAFTNPEDMAEQGLPVLPIDQSYEGSAFFVSHSNNQ
ncbi:MAG: hypothetical protein ACOYI8_11345 [Christensenellales bacterium]|jgi:hypothetical protein